MTWGLDWQLMIENVIEMLPFAAIICFGIFVQAAAGFAAGADDRTGAAMGRLLDS